MTLEEARERSRQVEQAVRTMARFHAAEERAGRTVLLTPDELAAYALLDAGWPPPSHASSSPGSAGLSSPQPEHRGQPQPHRPPDEPGHIIHVSEWNEAQHDRATDGTFREMFGSAPEGRLVLTPMPDAYRTIGTDGGSCTIDEDGFEQDCSCGNGSQSGWWAAGAADGTVTMDAVSRAHDDDTIMCPSCGRAYRHGDVDWGCSVAPVARFDVTDDAFAQALDHQHRMLFGSPRRLDNTDS